MKKERRTFSQEFKQEAVALVVEHGYSYAAAGRSLGIRGNLIGGIDKLTSSSGPTLPNAARFAPYLDRSAHTLLNLELWIAPNSHFFVQK